jgi:hypothetical protein
MQPALVARAPLRPRARLNLAPRLHSDETLSSWLERFAGAYAMSLREFVRWLGYPGLDAQRWGDLDVAPPPDLAQVIAPHAGIGAEIIAAHRMDGAAALPPLQRRAFCPECWAEEGPYRRVEWAQGWSLVCCHHRRLLSEKPRPKPPAAQGHEESWPEFYRAQSAWRDLRPSWQSEPWAGICERLGVEPRGEFMRTWPWLLELSRPAHASGRATARLTQTQSASGGREIPQDLECNELTVKQDLALYGMIQFLHSSLLGALDDTIIADDLMSDTFGGYLCDVRVPEVPYRVRLFAATVARHIWVRLTHGRWRCARYETLERFLGQPRRWNDEDWWLEQRLRTWPAALAASGRGLLRKADPFVSLPPWARCRECLRDAREAVRGGLSICLPKSWRCRARDPFIA